MAMDEARIEALADEVDRGSSRSRIRRELGEETYFAVQACLQARREASAAALQCEPAEEEPAEPDMITEETCSRCGCIVRLDEPVAVDEAPIEVWCETCEERRLREAQTAVVTDVLYALGWQVQGVSGRSEAAYYAHPDLETRIRIARHDAVYESSHECIQIGIGSGTVDAHVHVNGGWLDAEQCAEAAVEASRLARAREVEHED